MEFHHTSVYEYFCIETRLGLPGEQSFSSTCGAGSLLCVTRCTSSFSVSVKTQDNRKQREAVVHIIHIHTFAHIIVSIVVYLWIR